MDRFLVVLALVLVGNLVVGLLVVGRAADAPTRMLSAQLFGTTSVGVLLLLAAALDAPAARDIALVFALLAAVAAIAFGRRVLGSGGT